MRGGTQTSRHRQSRLLVRIKGSVASTRESDAIGSHSLLIDASEGPGGEDGGDGGGGEGGDEDGLWLRLAYVARTRSMARATLRKACSPCVAISIENTIPSGK